MIDDLERIIRKLETAIKVEQDKLVKMRLEAEDKVERESKRAGDLKILGRIEGMLGGVAKSLSNIKIEPDLSEIIDKIDRIEFPDRTNEILASINKVEGGFSSFDVLFANLKSLESSIADTRSAIGGVKIDDARFNDILVSLSNLHSRVSVIKMPDLEEIYTSLEHLKRPRSYYFTVNRDKNLLITSVEAEQT